MTTRELVWNAMFAADMSHRYFTLARGLEQACGRHRARAAAPHVERGLGQPGRAGAAADIMARSEITLSPDMDIFEALHELLDRKLTGAPVGGGDGTLLGDNPRLFGSKEEPVPDGSGVDSAMRLARARK